MAVAREKLLSKEDLPTVLTIFRGLETQEICAAVPYLMRVGLTAFEVTLNSPSALRSIAELNKRYGSELLIGAGTVLSPGQVDHVVTAGGRYIISPNFNASVVAATKAAGAVSIPGTTTVTEIFSSVDAGADIVKVFPAGPLGISYFDQIKAVLDDVDLMATGAVDARLGAELLSRGCRCLGVGAQLYDRDAYLRHDWAKLARGAQRYLSTVISGDQKPEAPI